MANKVKKKDKQEAHTFPRKTIPCPAGDTENETARNYARLTTSPELAAYRAINAVEAQSGLGEQLDVPALLEILRDQAAAVNRSDMAQTEAILMNQATALQSLFARLTENAMGADYLSNFEAYMRMALRAQSQCRATLEALSSIKSPPVVYAEQANVTTGPQQVNNRIAAEDQEREIKNLQTKLSGDCDELLPDSRTSGYACQIDPPVETLGEVGWAEVSRR